MAAIKNRSGQFTAYLRRVKSTYEATAGIKERNNDMRGFYYDMGCADMAETIRKRYEKIMKGRNA